MDPVELRPGILFIHVLAAFAFVMSHGVAMFVAFALRKDPEPARLRHLLELSTGAYPALYVSLLVTLVSGIAAAIIAGQFGRLWPWASIGVVIATFVAMQFLASGPLATLREAIGIRTFRMKKDDPDPVPRSPEEVRELVMAWRPEAVTVAGWAALVALIWLMRVQPF